MFFKIRTEWRIIKVKPLEWTPLQEEAQENNFSEESPGKTLSKLTQLKEGKIQGPVL